MSLRDEIEKLIDAKRKDLEQADAELSALDQVQRERFAPLRPVLAELVKSIEAEYLDVQIYDASASIYVTTRGDLYHDADLVIEIGALDETYWNAARGFYISIGHPNASARSRDEIVGSVQEVAQCLIRAVSAQVAVYRHEASLRARGEDHQ